DENVIVFDLDAFQLSRTPEDLWSTNRAIKNIEEIKLGLDSISTLVNDLKFQNYQTAEGIYPFFTKERKLIPPDDIKERKNRDDELRREKSEREKRQQDSLKNLKNLADSTLGKNVDSLRSKELQISVAASSGLSKSDSIFQLKT